MRGERGAGKVVSSKWFLRAVFNILIQGFCLPVQKCRYFLLQSSFLSPFARLLGSPETLSPPSKGTPVNERHERQTPPGCLGCLQAIDFCPWLPMGALGKRKEGVPCALPEAHQAGSPLLREASNSWEGGFFQMRLGTSPGSIACWQRAAPDIIADNM